MTIAQQTGIRDECKTMHESMMTKMPDGGMTHEGKMTDGPMMSSEMKSKHMACMELMPEFRAEMRAKCEAHKAAGIVHHMNGMVACAKMQSGADSVGN